MKSHYEVLDVDKDASEFEIRQAWRYASKKAHPDREGGSHEAMAAVNKAYEVLGDPERRKNYDATGESTIPDPLDVSARATMCLHFMEVIVDAPDNCDLVSETYRYLRTKLTKAQQEVNDGNALISKLQRRANRIKIKAKGADNFLVAAIEQRVTNTLPALERSKGDVAVLTRACEMVLEYKDSSAETFMRGMTQPDWNATKTIGHIAAQWPDGS